MKASAALVYCPICNTQPCRDESENGEPLATWKPVRAMISACGFGEIHERLIG